MKSSQYLKRVAARMRRDNLYIKEDFDPFTQTSVFWLVSHETDFEAASIRESTVDNLMNADLIVEVLSSAVYLEERGGRRVPAGREDYYDLPERYEQWSQQRVEFGDD